MVPALWSRTDPGTKSTKKGTPMKKLMGMVCVGLLLATAPAICAQTRVSLNVGTSTVAGSVISEMPTESGALAWGGEAVYKEDDYQMYEGLFAVKNDRMMPGFRYTLGFRPFFVNADDGDSGRDSNSMGLAFVFGMAHDLDASFNPIPIPVTIDCEVAGAPEPLNWEDGETYWEARAGVGFHIMENAAIRLDVRRLAIDFDENGYKWDKDDYNVTLGYVIRF